MRSRVKRFGSVHMYIYMCMCDPKKRLFCILPVIIHRQSLYNAYSLDLYVAKDAVDS